MEFLTLKPETFGLDISDSSLKIIKLKKRRGVLGLASFGEAKIAPGIIEEGEIKDREALAQTIKETLNKVKGEKLKTNRVVASLPEEKAFLQVIQIPQMKEEDVEKAVYFEVENHIPLPIEEVCFDFQKVEPICNHLEHFDILIVALPKKIVASYVAVLKEAKLIPQVLETESLAIARALIKNEVSPFPVLLIDLGATKTNFIIFSGNSLRFTSSFAISAQKFTEAISKALKIDLVEAEKLKLKYGLKEEGKERKIFEVLTPSLTELSEEIKTHLNYYLTHALNENFSSNGKIVAKILLCGEGADLQGLTDFLSCELKMPVELANPWVNILPEPLREVPEISFKKSLEFTTALGLALRGL